MRLLALACLTWSAAALAAPPTALPGTGFTDLTLGAQIASPKLGEDVRPLAKSLAVEWAADARRHDFAAAGLTIRAGKDALAHGISVAIKQVGGLALGGATLTAEAGLTEAAALPGCAATPAGVSCADHGLWFTEGATGLVAHVARPTLASLRGRWKVARIAEAPRHMLPRGDLKPGGRARITADQVKLGASKCEPKGVSVTPIASAEWLAPYKTDPAALGFEAPVVHSIATGCANILKRLVVVGDHFVAERDGNFYVFRRY